MTGVDASVSSIDEIAPNMKKILDDMTSHYGEGKSFAEERFN